MMEGGSVTWELPDHVVKCDVRAFAGRFIVIKRPRLIDRLRSFAQWRSWEPSPNVIAHGLIEDSGTTARVILDDPRKPIGAALQDAITVRWLQMQRALKLERESQYRARLREQRR